MSNDGDSLVWVSDLDGYIDIDSINRENEYEERQNRQEKEQNRLYYELDTIGDIQLLAGKATSARKLYEKGISPLEWRYALHKAEMVIGCVSDKLN